MASFTAGKPTDINPHAAVFEVKEIDASINICCWILTIPVTYGFCPYKTTLLLDNEEVTKTDISICGKTELKAPYGELGSVGKSNCCCFVSVTGGVGEMCIGCGCNNKKVDEIVFELKKRIRGRGDTAQIKRQEDTLKRLDDVESKLDLIIAHMKIPVRSELMTERS